MSDDVKSRLESAGIRSITTSDHIEETVATLERALVDAKAGQLSCVVVFGDVRGGNCLRTYKSAITDRIHLVGKLMHSIFEMCCELKE